MATIWAANGPLAKLGLQGLDVFVFNSIRYVTAFAVLLVILRSRTVWIGIRPEDRFLLLRWAVIASVVYQIVYILGLSLTTAGNTAVLLSTSPLWTAAISARMFGERLGRATILGMLVAVAGIVLMIAGSGSHLAFGGKAIVGDLLGLAAAALWGLNTNLQKPLLARYSALQLTTLSTGIGALGLTLSALPTGLRMDVRTVDPPSVLIALVSGATSIGFATLLWSYGVKVLGPRRTSTFNNLVPVLAFVISALIFGEEVTAMQIVGAALTVGGVWRARS